MYGVVRTTVGSSSGGQGLIEYRAQAPRKTTSLLYAHRIAHDNEGSAHRMQLPLPSHLISTTLHDIVALEV